MRKQDKAIIWPAYFDLNRTRKRGRRVAKNLAVPAPKILEIEEAVKRLKLQYQVQLEKGYSKTPWSKPGMMLVEKQGSKEDVINKIAKQLLKLRAETPKQQH